MTDKSSKARATQLESNLQQEGEQAAVLIECQHCGHRRFEDEEVGPMEPSRVISFERREKCVCLPGTSRSVILPMHYDGIPCEHHSHENEDYWRIERNMDKSRHAEDIFDPRTDREPPHDQFGKKERLTRAPGGNGYVMPLPSMLKEINKTKSAFDWDEEDDGIRLTVLERQHRMNRIDDHLKKKGPKNQEPSERKHDGKAFDPKTGKMYYYNKSTGERWWA